MRKTYFFATFIIVGNLQDCEVACLTSYSKKQFKFRITYFSSHHPRDVLLVHAFNSLYVHKKVA